MGPGGADTPFVNTFEVLSSSDQISNSMRPESATGRRKASKRLQQRRNRLPEDFTKETTTENALSACSIVKSVLLLLGLVAFVFGICLDLYLLHNLPSTALQLVLLALLAASVTDVLIQLLIILLISSLQTCYELKSHRLLLDTRKFT